MEESKQLLPLPPIAAWLAARSIARGLPLPVADCGGFRVDVNSADEIKRWVYPEVTQDLAVLARSISQPAYLVKALATPEQMRAALPADWQIHDPGYFMAGPDVPHPQPVTPPPSYSLDVRREHGVTEVRVLSESGELAASGYAAETEDIFIYDRIITNPAHQRRGLGRLVMETLRRAKVRAATPERLIATAEGRALYESLGWRTLSVFSTASRIGT